jgi:riboflavin kinase/FMN adenylyltransferase
VIARLRPEQKFAGFEALKAQIARDADDARARLAPLVADPAAEGAWH